jgi:hypothetical protein
MCWLWAEYALRGQWSVPEPTPEAITLRTFSGSAQEFGEVPIGVGFSVSGLQRLGPAVAACLGRIAHAAGIGARANAAAAVLLPAIGSSYHAARQKASASDPAAEQFLLALVRRMRTQPAGGT